MTAMCFTSFFRRSASARSIFTGIGVAAVGMASIGTMSIAHGDDIEIYLNSEPAKPNVLFIMDTSSSMAAGSQSNGGGPSRMEVATSAAVEAIEQAENVNLGLMRFDASTIGIDPSEGGYVDLAIQPIDDVKDEFKNKIQSYLPLGLTPLTETLHEAFNYLTGDEVVYGRDTKIALSLSPLLIGANASTPESRRNSPNDDMYQAPAANQCTKTKVILFSDGAPVGDEQSNTWVNNLINGRQLDNYSYISNPCQGFFFFNNDGICVEELANYMGKFDHRPDITGEQLITVDTVAAFLDESNSATTRLKNIAEASGGQFYSGDDQESIAEALQASIESVAQESVTFVAPSIPVANYNQNNFDDQIYFSLFKPSSTAAWQGNFKRYRLSSEGEIVDINSAPALNESNGGFSSDAISFWPNLTESGQPVVDGDNILLGGAANRYPEQRNIYTSQGNTLVRLESNPNADDISEVPTPSVLNLLTANLLGLTLDFTDELLYQVLAFILGYDVNNSASSNPERANKMGDLLHSQPVIVKYENNNSEKNIAFVATNHGFLHAINTQQDGAERGQEIFAFIPRELLKLPRLILQSENQFLSSSNGGTSDKIYGLDGQMSLWHQDVDRDGSVNNGEKIYLFVGMRRGGQSYYALDISNPEQPELLWQKHGQYLENPTINTPLPSNNFEQLGQSWSKPILAEVFWPETGNTVSTRTVLFVGAGYDSAEDGDDLNGPAQRIEHTIGNTVYMLDALTGDVLWNAEKDIAGISNGMRSSFPTDVVPVDINENGRVDLLYAADVGGRVWRFDINESATSKNDFATATVVADVNENTSAGNRRFFNSPDITVINDNGMPRILISIGSGYRAHPLTTSVSDKHYLIKDPNGFGKPTSYAETITPENLMEWADEEIENTSPFGWQIPLQGLGEKVLSPSTTLAGNLVFTTYTPPIQSDPCEANFGVTKAYTLSLTNPSRAAEVTTLEQQGIAPRPLFAFLPVSANAPSSETEQNSSSETSTCNDKQPRILVGTESVSLPADQCIVRVRESFWREL